MGIFRLRDVKSQTRSPGHAEWASGSGMVRIVELGDVVADTMYAKVMLVLLKTIRFTYQIAIVSM